MADLVGDRRLSRGCRKTQRALGPFLTSKTKRTPLAAAPFLVRIVLRLAQLKAEHRDAGANATRGECTTAGRPELFRSGRTAATLKVCQIRAKDSLNGAFWRI